MTTEEQHAVAATVSTVATYARELPCRDAARVLRGLLVIGGDHEALAPIRDLYHTLCDCEQQLDFLTRPRRHAGQNDGA